MNGIWQGAALALFAMGYVLVFGLLDIVNLAHGATYMWGAYLGLICVTRLGVPVWVAIPGNPPLRQAPLKSSLPIPSYVPAPSIDSADVP